MTDAAHQQWLAALGFAQENAQRQADAGLSRVENRVGFETPYVEEQGRRNLVAVGGQMENRGLTRSGEHLRRRAESRYDTAQTLGRLQLSAAEQAGSIEDTLASRLADLAMQDAAQANQLAYRSAYKATADQNRAAYDAAMGYA